MDQKLKNEIHLTFTLSTQQRKQETHIQRVAPRIYVRNPMNEYLSKFQSKKSVILRKERAISRIREEHC